MALIAGLGGRRNEDGEQRTLDGGRDAASGRRRFVVLAAALFGLWTAAPSAHEIPADVLVQMFVKPEGSHLRVLVRVPLAAARDIDFPLVGPGYLDLARADAQVRDAAWLWLVNSLEVYEGEIRLPSPRLVAARVSLPSDRSFASYEAAVAHVTGAGLPPETLLIWNQALLDVALEYPITSEGERFAIQPALGRLGIRVATVLRFLPPGRPERALGYNGDPGLVRLDPSWGQAARRFVSLGFRHILEGADHLLFLLCLVLPVRRLAPLALIVTAFTVAHSITLIASALDAAPGAIWFPPLIETLIATSIVYMALENIVWSADVGAPGQAGERPGRSRTAMRIDRRWIITFAFGLVHGFGFSFALRETLQFAGSHLLTSLLAFNLGVELGQLLVLVVLVPAIYGLFRFAVGERIGSLLISAFVAHQAWHWTAERAATLGRFGWPDLGPSVVVWTLRGAVVLIAGAGATWFLRRRRRDDSRRRQHEVAEGGAGLAPADRSGSDQLKREA